MLVPSQGPHLGSFSLTIHPSEWGGGALILPVNPFNCLATNEATSQPISLPSIITFAATPIIMFAARAYIPFSWMNSCLLDTYLSPGYVTFSWRQEVSVSRRKILSSLSLFLSLSLSLSLSSLLSLLSSFSIFPHVPPPSSFSLTSFCVFPKTMCVVQRERAVRSVCVCEWYTLRVSVGGPP